MTVAEKFCRKLEESGPLYNRLLELSRDMDANLGRWNAARISHHLDEVRKLQDQIRVLDGEIASFQTGIPVSAVCWELLLERKGVVRDILSILEKNKKVIAGMLTVLADDLATSKSFRHAAQRYFRRNRSTGRTFRQTV